MDLGTDCQPPGLIFSKANSFQAKYSPDLMPSGLVYSRPYIGLFQTFIIDGPAAAYVFGPYSGRRHMGLADLPVV